MELPALLAALSGTDEVAVADAYVDVWRRAFAGGALSSETAPVVRHLLTAVHDPAFGGDDDTIRTGMVFLLREIARVDPDSDLLPEMFAALWPVPAAWPLNARVAAASAAVMLVRHPVLAAHRDEVIAHHETAARAAADRHVCASYVVGLGELGVGPRDWLDDPRPGVRVCAALAPALATDEVAVDLLVRAAEHPRAFDHAFEEPFCAPRYRLMFMSQFNMASRKKLITTVCERVSSFPRLLRAAMAAADLRDGSVGPYLRAGFPAGLPSPGTASREQAEFAQALAARDDMWDRGSRRMFTAVGLPHDRALWRDVHVPGDRDNYDSSTIIVVDLTRFLRLRPRLWIGLERTDPGLPAALVDAVRRDGLHVDVEAPLRFTVTGSGALEAGPEDLVTGDMPRQLHLYAVRWAAAVSLWVTVHEWTGGTAYRQQFVDGAPLCAREDLGATGHDDGYRITFELDREWLAPS